jgi:SAM-dependent methyltransferase
MTKLDELQQWLLHNPLGQYVTQTETVFYHNVVSSIFGYYAVQVSLPQINLLETNRINSKSIVGHDIKSDLHFLPFANDSVDLIICPHILELTDNYDHFLEECYRILIPRGKIVISCFNPKSLFGLFGNNDPLLKQAHFISLNTLKQQLKALNFQIQGGKFLGYRAPLHEINSLKKSAWMDKVGDRWFPTFANSYGIIASKEIITINRATPKAQTVQTAQYAPNLGTATSSR